MQSDRELTVSWFLWEVCKNSMFDLLSLNKVTTVHKTLEGFRPFEMCVFVLWLHMHYSCMYISLKNIPQFKHCPLSSFMSRCENRESRLAVGLTK